MATNGIEILIDVLAQEAITTTDKLISVITDAAGKFGTLSGSVGELDAALTGITKSGMSAEDMAVKLVTVLEDFGIQTKDADKLSVAFSDTLKKVGISGKEASAGVESVTKANEQLVGSTNTATDAVARQTNAFKDEAMAARAAQSAVMDLERQTIMSSYAASASVADLGAGYSKMITVSEMATPALMKAASWAGIGLAGLAYEGIKQYTQFNKLITQTITQAGVAPSKMGFLSNLAESVAKSTGQHLNDVANTIYRAASGTASWNNGLGATKKQLGDIVTQVSKLNVVGAIAPGAESEQASRVVTALINAHIRGVGNNPTKAAALVNAAVGSGDMRLADLVPGIGRGLLSSAVANNMTAQDALAWVATLTSQGTTASVAGNYVKTGINLLSHPSAQGVSALAMLGIKPGELQNLMSGPGGLVAALSTLKSGMKHLNPGNAAQFFYHEAGVPRPGGGGLQGAVAKLQSWSAGELSQKFISDWVHNKLTPQEQTQATGLILTKAFGGSKQFATIAAVLNNLGLVKGIESHIGALNSGGYFNAQYARTAETPSQQFKRMQQSIIVDLVNIGKTLTPLGLTVGHAITGIISGLSKFKGVLYGFVAVAGSLLALAGAAKAAEIGSHLAPVVGAAYNRLGIMAGTDSAFTQAMYGRANGGGSKFLNIYKAKSHGILAKAGGESIAANGISAEAVAAGAPVEGLSTGENVLNSTMARGATYQEQTAANTRIIADEMAKGGFGGGGGAGGGFAGAGGGGGAAESAAQKDSAVTSAARRDAAAMATTTPRDAMYFGGGRSGARMAEGTIFKDPKSGRYTKVLANGRRTFVSNAEAYASGAMNGPLALGAGSGERLTAAGSADAIALGERSLMGGVDTGMMYGPALEGGLANAAAPALMDTAGTGILSNVGSSLGSFMGGPFGMIAMMAAPALIGALTPSLMKLGSFIGNWLDGGKAKAFHAHIAGQSDTTKAAAKIKADAAILHKYEKQVKDKAGKMVWVKNMDAIRADHPGYDKALKDYQKANHTYSADFKHANVVSAKAINAVYGPESKAIAYDARMAKIASKQATNGLSGYQVPGTQDKYMQSLINRIPKGTPLRAALDEMMKHHGANWQDFSQIITKQQQDSQGIVSDTFGSSMQWQKQHTPLAAALNQGNFFKIAGELAANSAGMKNLLGDKHVTVAQAAKDLPTYAHEYHVQALADAKALANKNLTPDQRAYFVQQKKSAHESMTQTESLINELKKSMAKDTHISGESVDRLAKQNAAALAANGVTANALASAIAKALSPYIKQPKVVGSGGPVTRTSPTTAALKGGL